MWTCNTCKNELPDTMFRIRNGKPTGKCKLCEKSYYLSRREHILASKKEKYANDPEYRKVILQNSIVYRETFKSKHPDYCKEYAEKLKLNGKLVEYKAKSKMRHSILKNDTEYVSKRRVYSKSYSKTDYGRFANQIHRNMSNALNTRLLRNMGFRYYGIKCKDILAKIGLKPDINHSLDHIIPLSAFTLSDELHVKLAYSPENLRWCTNSENTMKGSIIDCSLIMQSPALIEIAYTIGLKL